MSYTLAKTLVSPLFWFLLLCLGRGLYGITRGKLRNRGDMLLLIASIVIFIISLPAVAVLFSRLLVPGDVSPSVAAKRTIVVVLAGGSFSGIDGRPYLSVATIDRVLAGAATYRRRRATSMIMTGKGHDADPEASTRLMKELASGLGVPANRIAVEPRSRNTREHPIQIAHKGLASDQDALIIVTDPMHLRRSLAEFRRHFPNVSGVASVAPPRVDMRIDSFIPQADALDHSTNVLREFVGAAWYDLRARMGR